MKKPNLRQALAELKKAKSLAEGVTAATLLISQAAHKTGALLYDGLNTKSPKTEPKALAQQAEPTISIEPIYTDNETTNPAPVAETTVNQTATHSRQEKIELENKKTAHLSQNLVQFDFELRQLKLAYDSAATNEEKNALRFKILRVERLRREYLNKTL